MKSSYFFALILALFSILSTSCNQDSINSNSITNSKGVITPRTNKYLFSLIEITPNLVGNYSFVANHATVRSQVEDIYITENSLLTAIDTFGFAFTDLGTQYFYVTQFGATEDDGAVTHYVWLNTGSDAITTGSGSSGSFTDIKCVNDHCCETCVAHDSLGCTCNKTMASCIRHGETNIKCKKEEGTASY